MWNNVNISNKGNLFNVHRIMNNIGFHLTLLATPSGFAYFARDLMLFILQWTLNKLHSFLKWLTYLYMSWVARWLFLISPPKWGWFGMAKLSGILRHQGVQLILASSWARPAILVVGKGGGGCFLFCFFTFIPVPLSSLSLYFISSTISSMPFLPFSGRRHRMIHKGWRVV